MTLGKEQNMSSNEESRRSFLGKLSGSLIGLGLVGQLTAYIRSLVPNVLYEPAKKMKVGQPSEFNEGVRFLEEQRIYIFREKNSFYAISAVCTHLAAPSSIHRSQELRHQAKMQSQENELGIPLSVPRISFQR